MKVGILTIHKIFNFGSVLQAFALWQKVKDLGFDVEIIDYTFPNEYHRNDKFEKPTSEKQIITTQEKILKFLYARGLIRQHNLTASFLKEMNVTFSKCYDSPEQIESCPPKYDISITGSDQVWNPRYTKGDPIFMLSFLPSETKRISYASSFGTDQIPDSLFNQYNTLLSKYSHISVREANGVKLLKNKFGLSSQITLDPTLLLSAQDWNRQIPKQRLIKEKYIFCYFLNYTFDAFPYVEDLAFDLQKKTGLKLIFGGRPPKSIKRLKGKYKVGIGPLDFMRLIRDAELVLTTSFHGTAFAVNFSRPIYSIIKSRELGDDRQSSLLDQLGLGARVVEMNSPFPTNDILNCNYTEASKKLSELRSSSLKYLENSLDV